MIRPVIGTIATRVLVMLMNIGVIMLAGHRLGASGLGDISLVVLAITFILLLNNVIGGGAIVYLMPRHSLRHLLLPAYSWAVISCAAALLVVTNYPLTPPDTAIHVAILALLQSILSIHFNVLLGKQKIDVINWIQVIQSLFLLIAFAVILDRSDRPDVMSYILAAYVSHGLAAVISVFPIVPTRSVVRHDAPVLGKMFRQGLFIQIANFLQLLNYRLSYYLIGTFQGLSALGIYSVSNQLAESAWVGPKSIGSVLYGRVSNTTDPSEIERLTATAAKVCMAMALAVVIVIALMPDRVYQFLFGEEIIGVDELALLLSPGIMAMAISQALSHYFSGLGRNIHNMIGSGLGVIVTIAIAPPMIEKWGPSGAAITASIAYSANAAYQLIVFNRTALSPIAQLWSFAEDRVRLKRLLERIR